MTGDARPPRLARVLLRWCLPAGAREWVIGDLDEEYRRYRRPRGRWSSARGHLCHYKIHVLGLLGHPRESRLAAMFERTAASDGAEYPGLAELSATLSTLNAEVCTALGSASARLDRPMPGAGHGEKTLLDTVLFFAWHEAYHIGSIGAIRRELGRKAISDFVAGR